MTPNHVETSKVWTGNLCTPVSTSYVQSKGSSLLAESIKIKIRRHHEISKSQLFSRGSAIGTMCVTQSIGQCELNIILWTWFRDNMNSETWFRDNMNQLQGFSLRMWTLSQVVALIFLYLRIYNSSPSFATTSKHPKTLNWDSKWNLNLA